MTSHLVISICGPSGCGKSQTAKSLVSHLGDDISVRIPADYYLVPASGLRSSYLQQPLQYDWFLLEQAASAMPNTTIETPDFDFETFQRVAPSGGLTFIVRRIRIVDAMYPCPFADVRILLDAPSEARHGRITVRDQSWGTRVAHRWDHLELSKAHLESLQVDYDLHLSGTQCVESNVEKIVQLVTELGHF